MTRSALIVLSGLAVISTAVAAVPGRHSNAEGPNTGDSGADDLAATVSQLRDVMEKIDGELEGVMGKLDDVANAVGRFKIRLTRASELQMSAAIVEAASEGSQRFSTIQDLARRAKVLASSLIRKLDERQVRSKRRKVEHDLRAELVTTECGKTQTKSFCYQAQRLAAAVDLSDQQRLIHGRQRETLHELVGHFGTVEGAANQWSISFAASATAERERLYLVVEALHLDALELLREKLSGIVQRVEALPGGLSHADVEGLTLYVPTAK